MGNVKPDPIAATSHRARKRFGQNFLHDTHIIDRIVSALHPEEDIPLIEIGPGLGAITAPLLAVRKTLTAIEIDRDLARQLRERFPSLTLIEQDVLKCSLRDIISETGGNASRVRIVGNLPYNISTALIFHLLKEAPCIDSMYFMLQREVVERIAASPGGKDYGRLSVFVQFHCDVIPLFHIPPQAFHPVPKVESTLVLLKPRPFALALQSYPHFEKLVSAAFQQRRKTLRNALRDVLPQPVPEKIVPQLSARAETLSVSDYVEMSNLLFASARP